MAETNEFQTENEPLPDTLREEVEQPVTKEFEAAEVSTIPFEDDGFDSTDIPLTVVKDEGLFDDETDEKDLPVLTAVCTRDRHDGKTPGVSQESSDELPADEAIESVESRQRS